MTSAGRTVFQLGFEISPIILTGGIAAQMLGGMLPIVSIMQSADFLAGILTGSTSALNLDNYFAHFRPIPGSTLIDNQYGLYPFANQNVAANAVITQPLRISLRMDCPATTISGYPGKLAVLTALQKVLSQHTQLGGTYTVVTLAQIYTNQLLLKLGEISGGNTKQDMVSYQWDFFGPLITLAQAANAQNSLMSAISNGTPTDGSTSGPGAAVGAQNTLATPSVVPAASSLPGAGTTNSAFGPSVPDQPF
jgi:hypothetical protein